MPTLHRKKSWGHTAATCKEQSDQNQTHTSLSECLFNENRSKYFSENIDKVVVAEMTKPGTKAKKAKSGNEVPLSGGSLSPKPNIMYIEANRYTENTTLPHSNLHTMNAFSSSSLQARNALKPPHNWIVSIDGQHSKVLQKPKAMRYAFLPRRTGRPRTSRQLPYPRLEIAEPRLPPPRPNVYMEVNVDETKPPFPMLHPSTQKAASRTAKKANAQGG